MLSVATPKLGGRWTAANQYFDGANKNMVTVVLLLLSMLTCSFKKINELIFCKTLNLVVEELAFLDCFMFHYTCMQTPSEM